MSRDLFSGHPSISLDKSDLTHLYLALKSGLYPNDTK